MTSYVPMMIDFGFERYPALWCLQTMAPRTLRKALGAMKDQTSIALANVASTRAPELDIALVKATSHEEAPVDEKYVQEILQMTACSRGYVNVCVAGLARRLGKTRNWIVALKTLMLTHRLMREGDPQFETELKHAGRRGMRMLNLSHFRDDSNSSAWDYSAFVRTYALFIDEKLDSSSVSGDPRLNSGHIRSPVEIGRKSSFGMDDSSFKGRHRSPDRQSGRRHSFDGGQSNRSRSFDADKFELDGRLGKKERIEMKDMSITKVLEKLPVLQRLMDRILGCRPTGAAKTNRLVQIALYPLVKESYHLYSEICDGMTVILDGFFELEQANRVRAFEIYNQSAKQGDELAAFYNLCKNYGVGRSHEYPQVGWAHVSLSFHLEQSLLCILQRLGALYFIEAKHHLWYLVSRTFWNYAMLQLLPVDFIFHQRSNSLYGYYTT